MIPRVDRSRTHDASHLDVTLFFAELSNFFLSHLCDFFRLDVKILSYRLILMFRIVDEFETFAVSASLLFVEVIT